MPRGRPYKCPYDGSTNTTSKGSRKTKTMGLRKIRLCRDCGRKFTPRNQKPVEPNDATDQLPPERPIKPIEPIPPARPIVPRGSAESDETADRDELPELAPQL